MHQGFVVHGYRRAAEKSAAEAAAAAKQDGTPGDLKPATPAAIPTDAPEPAAGDGEGNAPPPADGMMAGVTPGVKTAEDEKKKMLPVTAFGRYIKILLSSNEFLFVS